MPNIHLMVSGEANSTLDAVGMAWVCIGWGLTASQDSIPSSTSRHRSHRCVAIRPRRRRTAMITSMPGCAISCRIRRMTIWTRSVRCCARVKFWVGIAESGRGVEYSLYIIFTKHKNPRRVRSDGHGVGGLACTQLLQHRVVLVAPRRREVVRVTSVLAFGTGVRFVRCITRFPPRCYCCFRRHGERRCVRVM